jgi:nucleoside-diphosphate-sugar epimerase
MTEAGQGRHVVVFGGAGYIGSALCRQLLKAGWRVTAFDRLLFGEHGVEELKAESGFTLHRGDLRQLSEVSAVLEDDVDAVVLLAALVGEKACDLDPRETGDTNFIGAKLVAEACKYYGIRRLIFASTDSAYGIQEGEMFEDSPVDPISLYARLKMEAEGELLALQTDAFHPTVLRMATIYGYSPRMRFDLVINILSLHAWANGRIKVFGGEQWRPLVHVEDAARAYVMALDAEVERVAGEVFNVGSNEQNFQVGILGEMVAEVFPGLEIETIPEAPDLRDYRVNFDKIKRVLGYEVQWQIPAGIAGIRDALDQGLIASYEDRKYYNA